MHARITLAILGVTSAACAQGTAYSLSPNSVMDREFCLPPCACPYVHYNGRVTGTFNLSLLDSNPLYTRYRLTNIQWYADMGPGSTGMTGSGIYTIGGEVALVHRLELALTIGILTVITDFDSGFVPVDPQQPFPRFAISTRAEPVCRRDILALIAAPVPVCYPNCDGSAGVPVLTANDFQCFLNRFVTGDSYANCDGSTGTPTLTANDFQCFINSYAAGCS